MASLKDDIIKYKKGELSSEQMHALEKKALADPFLAEALEGIDAISADELATDISTIEKNILRQRRKTLFTPLRIAAGIFLVATSLFITYQFIPKADTIAYKTESPKQEEKNEKSDEGNGKVADKTPDEKVNEEIRVEKKAEPVIPIRPAQDTKIRQQAPGVVEAPEKPTDLEPQPIAKEESVQELAVIDEHPAKTEVDLDMVSKEKENASAMGAGDANMTLRAKKKDLAKSEAQRSTVPFSAIQSGQTIAGQVVSSEDGSPLQGVNVSVKGTTLNTVTDLNGNYKISEVESNPLLVFSFIGLQQQEVDATGKSTVDVKMKDDISQLSEVVVSGVGSANDENDEPIITLAEPLGGKKAYNSYLESNLKYPEEALEKDIKGKSTVGFKVSTDGSLKDFRVIKKLGYGCDEELIRLIKEGPKWTPSIEAGKPKESTVRVRLSFDPAKSGKARH